jgi:hypothetical protein
MLKKEYDKIKKIKKQQQIIQKSMLETAVSKCEKPVICDEVINENKDEIFLALLISAVLICGIIILI